MILNGSALATFKVCPRKWWYSYKCKRALAPSTAMEIGLQVHHAWETGESTSIPWAEQALGEADLLLANAGVEVLAHELVLRAPFPPDELLGRLDALGRWEGSLWHIQLKTLSPSISLDAYIRSLASGYAEAIYRYLGAYNYNDTPWGGSIILAIRKPTRKGYPARVTLHPITQPGSQFEEILREIRPVADLMRGLEAMDPEPSLDPLPIPQNRTACFNHNSLCPYRDVCDGYRDIESFERRDPLSEYGLGDAPPAQGSLPPHPLEEPASPDLRDLPK